MIIWGGKDITKKGSYELNTDREIVVRILPPVNPSSFPKGKEGIEKLESLIRERMLCEVEKVRSKR